MRLQKNIGLCCLVRLGWYVIKVLLYSMRAANLHEHGQKYAQRNAWKAETHIIDNNILKKD